MPFPQRVRLLFGSLSPSKFGDEISSFADLGCLSRILNPEQNVSHPGGSRILDPNFFHPGSQIPDLNFFHPRSWIPDAYKKNLSILTKKNGFSALRNMIQVFHPGSGSRIWILTFYLSQIPILDPRSRIQGSKRQRIPDPRSRIGIRNTGDFGLAQAIGGIIGY
jgi:hypothetical protein